MKEAIREYQEKNLNLDKVAGLVYQFFQEEGFTVQTGKTSMGHLIQAKKRGFFQDHTCNEPCLHNCHRRGAK